MRQNEANKSLHNENDFRITTLQKTDMEKQTPKTTHSYTHNGKLK